MWSHALAVGVALAHLSACKSNSEAKSEGRSVAAGDAAPVEQALANIVATCADAFGTVEVRRRGEPHWVPLTVGTTLRERDWVRTSAGGFARLRFSGRGFVDLPEHATILVDRAIGIETGTLVAVAEPGGDPLVVRSDDGSEARIVAMAGGGVGPTELRLTRRVAGLEVAVTRGNVRLIARDGEQDIAAGEASELANHRPGAVVKLLGYPRSVSPGVDARVHFVAGQQIGLSWKPVPGAARYRVQVARDTEFHKLVQASELPGTSLAFAPDEVGEYAWRVAAVDAEGRLGEYGFARRIYVEAEPPRELLIAPADGARIGFADKQPRVTFSWRPVGDTQSYKLEIRRGDDPAAKPVVALTTTRQQVEVNTLREGTYQWGVYAVRDDRETPIFLAPRQLTIRKQRVKAHTDKLWDTGPR